MSVKFGVEDVRLCWLELPELVRLHREEVRGDEDVSEPDRDWYNSLTEAGKLVFYTARDTNTGALVGYATMLFGDDNQRKGELFANQDALFIRKTHRRGFVGGDFLRYIERDCKARGVRRIYQSVTPSVQFGPLLQRLGYAESTRIYSKELE